MFLSKDDHSDCLNRRQKRKLPTRIGAGYANIAAAKATMSGLDSETSASNKYAIPKQATGHAKSESASKTLIQAKTSLMSVSLAHNGRINGLAAGQSR